MINAAELLLASGKNKKDSVAASDLDNKITYGELLDSAYELALKINSCISKKNNPILIITSRNIESIIAIWGTVCSGNFYVCVDSKTPASRIQDILDYIEPKAVVIADSKFNHDLKNNRKCLSAEKSSTKYDFETIHQYIENLNITESDPLYMVFTSGSTGTPKAVIKSNRSIIAFAESFTKEFKINGQNSLVFGNQASFDFDVSAKDIFISVFLSSEIFIIPNSAFLVPQKLSKVLKEHNVSMLIWAASAIKYVQRFDCFKNCFPEKIERVFFSGECMTGECISYWKKYLPDACYVNLYAPSEVTGNCLYYVAKESSYSGILPLETCFSNSKVLIINEEGKEIENGEKGEILVGGAFLSIGYYKRPDSTADRFIQNPHHNDYSDVFFKTGDFVVKEGNYLYFSGRVDNQIKHMGHRIELEEIECHCQKVGIEAETCAIYDEENEKIVLYVDNRDITYEELISKLRQVAPKYMLPHEVFYIEKIPHTQRGKLARNELKIIYKETH